MSLHLVVLVWSLQHCGSALRVSLPGERFTPAPRLQTRSCVLITSKHLGLCKGIISRSELSRRLRIPFPWKLACEEKCGIQSLAISYLKLYTWLGNPGCSSVQIAQPSQLKHSVPTDISNTSASVLLLINKSSLPRMVPMKVQLAFW